MHRIVLAALLTLAACSSPANDNSDGGPVPTALCTTPDCANNPCTPGCVFAEKSGGCPCEFPTAIATDRVTSCANRCGLRDANGNDAAHAAGGYCSKYDASAPGCTAAAGCAQAACYPNDGNFDPGGASICAADETCTDGANQNELMVCDMAGATS